MSYNNSLLGLKIMDVLRTHSSKEKPLTQQDIVKYLKADYNTEVERKAVGRNINILVDYDNRRHIGYQLVKRMQGGEETDIRTNFYYKSDLEDGEMQMLIDSILSNRHISLKSTRYLINKISEKNPGLKKKGLRDIAFYDPRYKQDIPNFFPNTEKVMDAIENHKDIIVSIGEYDRNLKLVEGRARRVSPIQLFMYEQTYYLFALKYAVGKLKVDGKTIFRPEIIRVADLFSVSVLEKSDNTARQDLAKAQPGMNFTMFIEQFPYMEVTPDRELTRMEFVIPKSRLKDVVARFGQETLVQEIPNSKWINNGIWGRDTLIKVSVKTTKPAMERFMQEHRDHLYMLDPINMNWEYYIEKRRQSFEKAVKEQVFTEKDQERLRESVQSDWYIFKNRVDSSDALTEEEKHQMNQLLRKMLDPKWKKKEKAKKEEN